MSTLDSWFVGGVDIATVADLPDFTEVLRDPPAGGELVERDFIAGGVWITAPPAAYAYSVPLVMDSDSEDVALAQLATIQSWVGQAKTFTRTVTRGATQVTQSHQGLITDVTPLWDLTNARNLVEATVTVLNTSGRWS